MKECPNGDRVVHPDDKYLEGLVRRICRTYEDQTAINHLEGANLPNKTEILTILHDLLEIVFPGYSGKRETCLATIHYTIGEILARIYTDLYDQIGRCFRYHCRMENCSDCDVPKMTEAATHGLLDALPELRETMKADVAAALDGDPAAKSLDEIILSYPGIRAITIQRLANILYKSNVPLMPRLIGEYAHTETGIDIHPGAALGKGLFIDHGTGVVIGETAVIGDSVKIYQGVTLGALSFPKDACGKIIKGRKRHPTIEKGATIYAGATILGDIIVGEGSIIGGNVWLTQSVPPGTKIAIAPPEQTVKTRPPVQKPS